MELGADGDLRPSIGLPVTTRQTRSELHDFGRICPGTTSVSVHENSPMWDAVFGPYVPVWVGWAADSDLRLAGSSGGVIAAFSELLRNRQTSSSTIAAISSREHPECTVPIQIISRDIALAAAG